MAEYLNSACLFMPSPSSASSACVGSVSQILANCGIGVSWLLGWFLRGLLVRRLCRQQTAWEFVLRRHESH